MVQYGISSFLPLQYEYVLTVEMDRSLKEAPATHTTSIQPRFEPALAVSCLRSTVDDSAVQCLGKGTVLDQTVLYD